VITRQFDDDVSEDVARFARLWNGSEPGWTVHVHHEHAATVWVPIQANELSPSLFKTMRVLFSEHSAISTSEFRTRIFAVGGLESNRRDGIDALHLHAQCIRAGLTAERRDRSRTFYRLTNERTNTTLSIENEELHQQVAEEAIRRGRPKRESTT
jgi:hypothetical protein